MTAKEYREECRKVDMLDCKKYAVDLYITEKSFKLSLKLFIGIMNIPLDEIMGHGENWHLWF